jgi:hypothetical protein
MNIKDIIQELKEHIQNTRDNLKILSEDHMCYIDDLGGDRNDIPMCLVQILEDTALTAYADSELNYYS